MRLEYTPMQLLQKINKMSKMSTFNKDQCVRMLEALVDNPNEDAEESRLKMALFEKFFTQLQAHQLNLNSFNICRAFACLETLTKQEHIRNSNKELASLQKKAEFLIGRLTEMLSRSADVAVLDLYWSNKFVSKIDQALVEELGKTAGYTPLDLR